jgi:hypothetical protein
MPRPPRNLSQHAIDGLTSLYITIDRVRHSGRLKRIRRTALDIATGASAVFCVASIALWTRSNWGDRGQFTLHGRLWTWSSRHGSFAVTQFPGALWAPPPMMRFSCDYWFLTLTTLLLPVWRWRTQWRHKPTPTGAVPCAHCGYDLRATPARCPECGNVPSPQDPSQAETEG